MFYFKQKKNDTAKIITYNVEPELSTITKKLDLGTITSTSF